MAYNGSGSFTLVSGNPVVTGTTISSTWANNTLSDIATGLSTAITKDGQTTLTANIPLSNFKITGSAAATGNGDLVRFEQVSSMVQSQAGTYFTLGGGTTAYTMTPTPAITSLVAGQRFNAVINAANTTTTPTLAISGLTAKSIKIYNSAGVKVDPPIGALAINLMTDIEYDGTDYVALDVPGPVDEPVNAQTGTTYTYLTGDKGKLVTHSNGSAIAGTLPQAGTTFPSGWWMDVQNRGAGALTITPTTSTIDGASSLALSTNRGVRIVSDGTNYFTQRGSPDAITSGTAQTTTSGTSKDYTGLPAGLKRITVMYSAVSTNGTSLPIVQLGTSGGVETSGYISGATANGISGGITSGFQIDGRADAAASRHGTMVLTLLNAATNLWTCHGADVYNGADGYFTAGSKALAATLDRIRITTVNGTDAFDAGIVNIMYE